MHHHNPLIITTIGVLIDTNSQIKEDSEDDFQVSIKIKMIKEKEKILLKLIPLKR